ncbi:hypothetical protein HYS49_00495 [Candidatus Woesearchaeota archaeon]|nr:hypothetical protein [Candidatus Woesearchaeota archaeon]
MREYEHVDIEEAGLMRIGSGIGLKGKIRGNAYYPHFYIIDSNQNFLFIVESNSPYQDHWQRIVDKLETAKKKNLEVHIEGRKVPGGIEAHEVISPEQSGELSLYQGPLEGALSVSEEEGKLSIAEGEE